MKKTLTFIAAFIIAGALPAAFAMASFSDVPKSHVNYDAISYVESEGIVSGYPDGTFKSDNKINRAEFTKILVGTALDYDPGKDPSGFDIYSLSQIPFSDISPNDWYIPFVRKAMQNDIIAGYPDNTFRGANEINKAEAAKIIVKSLGLKTLDESSNTNWYDIYIYALEEIDAIPVELACSDMPVTRGQLAEIIWRVKNNITFKESAHTLMARDNGKLFFISFAQTWACDEKGFMTDTPIGVIKTTGDTCTNDCATSSTPKTVTLDDSDPENGSTMYDFDTEQRTNTNVSPDMMLSGMFYESTWMRGVDWQVVPMEGKFDEIASCPADGYSGVYNVDENGFGSPYYAYQGDIYCLETTEGKHVLLEVLESYNEDDNRFLTFKYLTK